MDNVRYVKAFFVWCGFLTVAMIGGIIREIFLVALLGPETGHALGTVLVAVAIFALIYVYMGKLSGARRRALLKLGIFWTVLTLAFEFLFGHYVVGLSWEALWADYDIFQGRLWLLVLLVTWFGPLLAREIRDYGHGRQPA